MLRCAQTPERPHRVLNLILRYLTSVSGINYLMAPGRIWEQGLPQAVWGPQSRGGFDAEPAGPSGERGRHSNTSCCSACIPSYCLPQKTLTVRSLSTENSSGMRQLQETSVLKHQSSTLI